MVEFARLRLTLAVAVRILFVAGLLIAPAAATSAAGEAGQDARPASSSHMLIENVGQYDGAARFFLKRGDRDMWLTDDAIWLTVPDPLAEEQPAAAREPGRQRHRPALARPGAAIRFTFEGANPAAALEPFGPLPAVISYLLGSDPAGWRTNVPAWSGVRYRDLYPGVDLVVGDGGDAAGTVPWRLEARPGADLHAVALRAEGADAITAEAGKLRLEIRGRTVAVALPGWSLDGQGAVASAAVQQDGATFALSPTAELQAAGGAAAPDAVAAGDLVYNTALAGAAYDASYAVAADGVGNTYITGETTSKNLPVTPGAYDPTNGGATEPTEAFVAKYGPTGAGPVYLTYLGGSGLDIGWGIAVSGGLAFVAGETTSTNFPGMTGAVVGTDAFVVSLNAGGTGARYVTRTGGAGYDAAYALAVEGLDAYFTGMTRSPTVCAGSESGDLLAARLNSAGGQVYATCLANPAVEAGYAVAVRSGEAYVAGEIAETYRNAIVARFNPSGQLVGGREVGGLLDDWANGIAVDAAGVMYLSGTTSSTDFPITAGAAGWGGGATDMFVARLAPPDFLITLATYLGGSGDDYGYGYGYGIVADTVQALYVVGSTTSTNFPVTTGAYDVGHNGAWDVFVARLHLGANSTAPNKVTYATFLGAAGPDYAYGVATDTGGHAYVVGSNATSEDPATYNGFVAKLKVSSPLAAPTPFSVGVSGANALLTWGAVTSRSYYQVFSSSYPYFQPGDWSSLNPLVSPTGTSYSHAGVLSAVDAHYYVVKTVDAAPAASGNSVRVGEFTFGLTKGTP